MAGPLEGVKVVELGVWVAGPAAGGILADWGAEVVKIEPPAGDPSRTFQYSLTGQMMPTNPIFEMDNRSKRSIVLDLTTPEGKEIADDLIAGADVFVTNVRLGGLERLGLDAETLTFELIDQTLRLQVDHFEHLAAGELVEHDDLVDAVEELGPEVLLQRIVDLLLHALVAHRGVVGGEADVGLA